MPAQSSSRLVGLSSAGLVDVGYAVMQGATSILDGLLPYGHIVGVLHRDTYPIGSYLFYVPFAWISPVRDAWNSANLTLVVAVRRHCWQRGNRTRGATITVAPKRGRGEAAWAARRDCVADVFGRCW